LGLTAKVDTLVESNPLWHQRRWRHLCPSVSCEPERKRNRSIGNVIGASAAVACVDVDKNQCDQNWSLVLVLEPVDATPYLIQRYARVAETRGHTDTTLRMEEEDREIYSMAISREKYTEGT
jgi:hypothetical protein